MKKIVFFLCLFLFISVLASEKEYGHGIGSHVEQSDDIDVDISEGHGHTHDKSIENDSDGDKLNFAKTDENKQNDKPKNFFSRLGGLLFIAIFALLMIILFILV